MRAMFLPAPRSFDPASSSFRGILFAALAAGAALGTAACSDGLPEGEPGAGCLKDTDCKGDRVCVSGSCQEPATGKSAPSVTPTPAPTPKKTASPARTASDTGSGEPSAPLFRAVPESEWKPLLNSKQKPGAEVAHAVFEGPFGPSPKSMFVVTKEGDDFFATVWADGKSYREGPLANNGSAALRIPAVSFFDADGDGAPEALVIAKYAPKGGGPEGYDNVLLRWKNKGLVRMKDLEAQISSLESVGAIRAKLKR